jgi:hypothetical protein
MTSLRGAWPVAQSKQEVIIKASPEKVWEFNMDLIKPLCGGTEEAMNIEIKRCFT